MPSFVLEPAWFWPPFVVVLTLGTIPLAAYVFVASDWALHVARRRPDRGGGDLAVILCIYLLPALLAAYGALRTRLGPLLLVQFLAELWAYLPISSLVLRAIEAVCRGR